MTIDSPTAANPDEAAPVCPTCGHPDSVHDVIGRRWCAVTVDDRGCICSREVQKTRVLSHY